MFSTYLLLLISSITLIQNNKEIEVEFNACNYTIDYRESNLQIFNNKDEVLKECESIRASDQRLRGAERELMNDVQNILKLSVILENQLEGTNILDNELLQTINIVLTHNPYYFTKYFHRPLFEIIKSNRCDFETETIILIKLYKNLFGQPYIDNETRLKTQVERNQVMTRRIKEEIDQKIMFKDLCSTVDSFIARKIIFHDGKVIGKWRRLRTNEDIIITIREKDNGDLYMIRTDFDSAFPSIKKIIRTKHNKLKYVTPFSSRVWRIAANGSLEFKYNENDIKIFTYPIYHEN